MRYRQEYYAGEAEDNGEVLSVDELVEVPDGHYNACCSPGTRTPSNRTSRSEALRTRRRPRARPRRLGRSGREELIASTRCPTAPEPGRSARPTDRPTPADAPQGSGSDMQHH